MITLDGQKKEPLYYQLYQGVKEEIQSGRWPAHTKIPSKRKMATTLQVSLHTVESAYQNLVSEGYLESRQKQGYFVCNLDEMAMISCQIKPNNLPKEEPPWAVDFSSAHIDHRYFPIHTWRKLYKQLLESWDKTTLKQSPPQGEWALRQSVSNYLYQSRGVDAPPENILIGAGSSYLLLLLNQILINPLGIAIEDPAYGKAYQIFKSCGHTVYPIPIDGGGVPVAALRKMEADVLYITPSHQFPLGIVMPIGRRIELLNWAREKEHRYIIEDDYNNEFRYTGHPIPAMQGLDVQRVIYMGTFSGCIAPSVRMSYMALPPSLWAQYEQRCHFYDATVPLLEQQLITQFFEQGYFEKHMNKMRKIYRTKRAFMLKILSNLPQTSIVQGDKGGRHLLLRFENGLSENEICTRAASVGIKVYPVSQYFIGAVPRELDATVLLGYAALSEEEIAYGIGCLAKVCELKA